MKSNTVSAAVTRRVWAEVTKDPQATVRELAERTGVPSSSNVYLALVRLRDAGYIDFAPNTNRTRRIIVPFAIINSHPVSNQENQAS